MYTQSLTLLQQDEAMQKYFFFSFLKQNPDQSFILMNQIYFNILHFVIPCWITNISFQCLWVFRKNFKETHIIHKINEIYSDIIFFDRKKLLGGGLKILSLIPVICLPFFFNLFLPESLLYYFILTSSVYTGDLLGSFIKRRLNYKKGEFMPFIDHGDYILTAGIIFLWLRYISIETFIWSLLLTYTLHPIVCVIGHTIGFKKDRL